MDSMLDFTSPGVKSANLGETIVRSDLMACSQPLVLSYEAWIRLTMAVGDLSKIRVSSCSLACLSMADGDTSENSLTMSASENMSPLGSETWKQLLVALRYMYSIVL